MAVTPDQDNFSSVSWSEHAQEESGASGAGTSSGAVAGDDGAAFDGEPAGEAQQQQRLGSERLECTVDTPIKENDGTKDAFVSYLITTSVSFSEGYREEKEGKKANAA